MNLGSGGRNIQSVEAPHASFWLWAEILNTLRMASAKQVLMQQDPSDYWGKILLNQPPVLHRVCLPLSKQRGPQPRRRLGRTPRVRSRGLPASLLPTRANSAPGPSVLHAKCLFFLMNL